MKISYERIFCNALLTTLGEIWLKETELRTIAVAVRLVEEHQVDVVGLQFAQTLVDALHGLFVPIVGRPDLGNEGNLIVVILSCYIPHRSQPPATRWMCSRQEFQRRGGRTPESARPVGCALLSVLFSSLCHDFEFFSREHSRCNMITVILYMLLTFNFIIFTQSCDIRLESCPSAP